MPVDVKREEWTPDSWKEKPVAFVPELESEAVSRASKQLSTLPPLVTSWEIERLRSHLAEAAEGRRFMLQGGDCAEKLADCNPSIIANKLKILLQMSLVLTEALKKPIIRVGRFAGQYAKPRSSNTESRNGSSLPSYFGDMFNAEGFDEESRKPSAERMLSAYHHAAMTLNFIRALVEGGFADLHHPEYWDLNFLGKASLTPRMRSGYLRRVEALANAIDVMEALGGRKIQTLSKVEFYTSHEGLNLVYESALTRRVPRFPGHFDLSCHLPWIGERTRNLDGAHIEFFRGIRNPVGVKISGKADPEDVVKLFDRLDPKKEPGRMVFIGRFGAKKVRESLPRYIDAMRKAGRKPVWVCDPMHGNTISTESGIKTRQFDDILNELITSIEIHREMGSPFGGVHFELTAEAVTECLGGASGVTEQDLESCYQSACDPRLNYEQAMELAFAIADRMES